jgi:hypothetical protein
MQSLEAREQCAFCEINTQNKYCTTSSVLMSEHSVTLWKQSERWVSVLMSVSGELILENKLYKYLQDIIF